MCLNYHEQLCMRFYHRWRCESFSFIHELMKITAEFDDEIVMDCDEISDVYVDDCANIIHY